MVVTPVQGSSCTLAIVSELGLIYSTFVCIGSSGLTCKLSQLMCEGKCTIELNIVYSYYVDYNNA